MKWVMVYTSDMVIPEYTDWLLQDITRYGLSVSNYVKKPLCNTSLPVVFNKYRDRPDFETILARFASPKQQRFVEINFDEGRIWDCYQVQFSPKDTLDDRFKAVHKGPVPFEKLIPFIFPQSQKESELFAKIGFGTAQK